MGIPAYFRHLVRNHPNTFSKINRVPISHFLIDSNSIIYDVVHATTDYSYSAIIQAVIDKIKGYIAFIGPSVLTIIAFDGVAPSAKLVQQKQRRLRASIEAQQGPAKFDTTQITPGTPFMNELNARLQEQFTEANNKILLFTSNEPGEGEHKLFAALRSMLKASTKASEEPTVLVYGLDADLIMLSLAHLPTRIYLYRDRDNDLIADHFLDINALAAELGSGLTAFPKAGSMPAEPCAKINTLDYLFIGFFLGNDFMPKFPSLCIRTDGIERLMTAYAAINKPLTNGTAILWRNVRQMIVWLAANEHAFLLQEYAHRRRQAKHIKPEDAQLLRPLMEREIEEYIAPERPLWQDRYYQTLFRSRTDRRRQIALNYLEGLEWTLRYYLEGCPDWAWTYKYDYPPLLEDLAKYVPYFETEFIAPNANMPVTVEQQLAFVMPKPTDKYEICRAFCKFDWEAHLHMTVG